MPAEEQRSGGMRSGAHEGLICPLEKGVRGIGTSGSGYLRQQIRGGRKGRAERQGLGQSPNKTTKLGGLRRSSEPQEAFVNDNETVEAEALEDAEAGVTVTVAMPWEAGQTVTVAVPRDVTLSRESVTELEAARERTMT